MKILITGAKGFVGRNLAVSLECIQNGKDRSHMLCGLADPSGLEIVRSDKDSTDEVLDNACRDCMFVFHLAGVNRPKEISSYMKENFGFTDILIQKLRKHKNTCPVMIASSIQASLTGRYQDSEYGKSKLAGENLLFSYGQETGARVLVYRFPNLFGKWCRPDYNSVVATFCSNTANDLSLRIDNRDTQLELLYIDDLVTEMIGALNGNEHRCEYEGLVPKAAQGGRFCYVPKTYRKTLGEIADLLEIFKKQPQTIMMPEMPRDSFEKKLYATYLSYLPPCKIKFPLKMNLDERGSFTELLRTSCCGQFSVNISRPGAVKGQHWHHTKWEFFMVVSGHGLIRERQVGVDEQGKPYPVLEFEVSGERIEAVHMLPGYVHSIHNLSDTEDLVTLMWANEPFDRMRADTYSEPV